MARNEIRNFIMAMFVIVVSIIAGSYWLESYVARADDTQAAFTLCEIPIGQPFPPCWVERPAFTIDEPGAQYTGVLSIREDELDGFNRTGWTYTYRRRGAADVTVWIPVHAVTWMNWKQQPPNTLETANDAARAGPDR